MCARCCRGGRLCSAIVRAGDAGKLPALQMAARAPQFLSPPLLAFSVFNPSMLRIFELAHDDPDFDRCLALRHSVFVHEQGVPAELERSDEEQCRHFLAVIVDEEAGGEELGAIATARLRPLDERSSKLERMAVIPEWRGKGVGRVLLGHIESRAAESGIEELVLNAQVAALPFYERAGYRAEGEAFVEAGIAHRRMRKRLAS